MTRASDPSAPSRPVSRATAGQEAEREAAAWCRLLEGLEPTLAHDLRGPLNALTLHLELVRRYVDGIETAAPADRLRRSVEALDREVGRLTAGMNGLLRLVGAPQDPPVSSSLSTLLQECEQDLRTAARHRGVELRIELESDGRLRQREVLRRALLLLFYGVLQRASSGDTIVVSGALEDERVAIELEPRTAREDQTRSWAPLDLAVVDALLHRCGGGIVEGHGGNGAGLRLRFPADVAS
jgi:signal transduction histidine kinase